MIIIWMNQYLFIHGSCHYIPDALSTGHTHPTLLYSHSHEQTLCWDDHVFMNSFHLKCAFNPLMPVLLHMMYGQCCYTEYVTVLALRSPSFLPVTRRDSPRCIKRIRYIETVYLFVYATTNGFADNGKNKCITPEAILRAIRCWSIE
jgi:hypothetical protein